MLKQKKPELLCARKTVIELFDIDPVAPTFGIRALQALTGENAPLANLPVTLKYINYDWNDVSTLKRLLIEIDAHHKVVAASSEGGLLEYGSDDAIAENLTILREQTGDTFFFVCSVFRDEQSVDPSVRLAKANSQLGIRFLGRLAFADLSHRFGWVTRWAEDNNPVFEIAVLSKRKSFSLWNRKTDGCIRTNFRWVRLFSATLFWLSLSQFEFIILRIVALAYRLRDMAGLVSAIQVFAVDSERSARHGLALLVRG